MITRPQPFSRIIGSTSLVAWKAEERLIAMMASHFSSGNSSIGATCWMPALFTMMSTVPKVSAVWRIIWPIALGLLMSAGE